MPSTLVSSHADQSSHLRRSRLRAYTSQNGLAFCDLTDSVRLAAKAGVRQLFGRKDGIHWSATGSALAKKLVGKCLRTLYNVDQLPLSATPTHIRSPLP